MAGLQFWEKKCFRLDLNESREGFCRRGRGRSFHVDGPKTEGAGTHSGESVASNLEAESIRSGAESTGGRVKLKTIVVVVVVVVVAAVAAASAAAVPAVAVMVAAVATVVVAVVAVAELVVVVVITVRAKVVAAVVTAEL